ncbi:hypothetical protein [Halogeometricum borinquense]|uniref:hypothetical protein n=1 Tax=Halogeometricum borinquense TaxID=60847 RepID=UPI003433418F
MSDDLADSFAVSESAISVGARHLTVAFVIFAVGNFVAGQIGDIADEIGFGVFVYAIIMIPVVYFAAQQFLRGIAIAVDGVR